MVVVVDRWSLFGEVVVTSGLTVNKVLTTFLQIGLVEKEWLDTLSTIHPEEVTFTDYVEAGTMLARELKSKGCHCVIALTHMRTPNDVRLAENVAEIDLILGGHDHVYEKKKACVKFCNYFIISSL